MERVANKTRTVKSHNRRVNVRAVSLTMRVTCLVLNIVVRRNDVLRGEYRCAKFKRVLMIELITNQSKTVMIHTQVHLRIPCYDFYFL